MTGGGIELQEIKSNKEREGLGGYDDEEDDIEILSLDNSTQKTQ